eukprot:Amastigsp_a846541_10.p2 type:complete len:177 gc:universal Amastigsp_a846541_10:951-1481(+)
MSSEARSSRAMAATARCRIFSRRLTQSARRSSTVSSSTTCATLGRPTTHRSYKSCASPSTRCSRASSMCSTICTRACKQSSQPISATLPSASSSSHPHPRARALTRVPTPPRSSSVPDSCPSADLCTTPRTSSASAFEPTSIGSSSSLRSARRWCSLNSTSRTTSSCGARTQRQAA